MAYKKLALVLGNCLFPDHSPLNPDKNTLFFMAEDEGLCTHFKYHKHKLMLFLSAMRSHADTIDSNYNLTYWKLTAENSTLSYEDKLVKTLEENPAIKKIVTYVIEDKFFKQKIHNLIQDQGLELEVVDSQLFMNTQADFADYLSTTKKPFMHRFYIEQRKKFGVLLDDDNKPVGGKWSYDAQNRKKLPKDIFIPNQPSSDWTSHTHDVAELVNLLFADHPGSTENFSWATTRRQVLYRMKDFFQNRFQHFGPYEDAIDSQKTYLFHSVLSAYINMGLVTSLEVLEASLDYASQNEIHLPSVEGFVRQLMGWREFMRGMYHHFELKGNYFGHQNKMNSNWYNANTGVPPLDSSISKVTKNAYVHHIERLMVLGNIMLLSEIHPDEVYKWFMEMFIDSSDWVMVPNIYGMSQFADGGTFATKPYIGGSNYIAKMSDYSKSGQWSDEIDGLYWRFINNNRKLFKNNPRMSMMVSLFDKMDSNKKARLMKAANNFIERNTK